MSEKKFDPQKTYEIQPGNVDVVVRAEDNIHLLEEERDRLTDQEMEYIKDGSIEAQEKLAKITEAKAKILQTIEAEREEQKKHTQAAIEMMEEQK